jgi:hypothetical protein
MTSRADVPLVGVPGTAKRVIVWPKQVGGSIGIAPLGAGVTSPAAVVSAAMISAP